MCIYIISCSFLKYYSTSLCLFLPCYVKRDRFLRPVCSLKCLFCFDSVNQATQIAEAAFLCGKAVIGKQIFNQDSAIVKRQLRRFFQIKHLRQLWNPVFTFGHSLLCRLVCFVIPACFDYCFR